MDLEDKKKLFYANLFLLFGAGINVRSAVSMNNPFYGSKPYLLI